MTTYEERQELMSLARQMIAVYNEVKDRVNLLTNKLIAEGDQLATKAADEKSAGENITKRTVKYTKQDASLPPPKVTGEHMVAVARMMPSPPVLEKGKRACSLCHHPGHRAANCPNAHLVREEEIAAKAAGKVKKSRAPLSPERKAQLAEQLKAARAARAKKGKK